MPILNSVYKGKKLFTSEFFCPNCFVIRNYEIKPRPNDVTLYPIPFVEKNEPSHVIECQFCKNVFDPQLLKRSVQNLLKLVVSVKCQLERGITPGSLKLRLMSDGLKEVAVDRLLTLAQR
jgi:hypothetical protein